MRRKDEVGELLGVERGDHLADIYGSEALQERFAGEFASPQRVQQRVVEIGHEEEIAGEVERSDAWHRSGNALQGHFQLPYPLDAAAQRMAAVSSIVRFMRVFLI